MCISWANEEGKSNTFKLTKSIVIRVPPPEASQWVRRVSATGPLIRNPLQNGSQFRSYLCSHALKSPLRSAAELPTLLKFPLCCYCCFAYRFYLVRHETAKIKLAFTLFGPLPNGRGPILQKRPPQSEAGAALFLNGYHPDCWFNVLRHPLKPSSTISVSQRSAN